MPEIKIKPIANFHSQFLLISGIVLMSFCLLLSTHFWVQIKLVLIFMILVAIMLILLGIVKKLEPTYSFYLSPKKLKFCHKYGEWQINWDNIQRIGEVRLHNGVEHSQLPYVGISVKSIEPVVDTLSLRLASRLPHEQRPLLLAAVTHSLLPLEQAQLNFSCYKFNNQNILNGPLALFLHHTDTLKLAYGYHLYLPVSCLDRSSKEFISLLRQCILHHTKYQ